MEQQSVKVEVSKDFEVPVASLYNAWVNTEELKKWWKPAGNHLSHAEANVSEGGEFRYVFSSQDGTEMLEINGTYKEVEEQAKLVYTWNWNVKDAKSVEGNKFLLKVNFTSINDRSSIRIVQENFDEHESIHPHEDGWNDALHALNQYLTQY